MRELALFAGAGGGILGGHLLGWRTVCAVEWSAYPASVLLARQNDGALPPFPVWDDVQTFDGRPWRGLVDVVSGGFPCQDISAAGSGAGIEGERSGMWKHMARIVGEVRPRFVFVENSPLLVGRGLAVVLGDLADMGYDAQWFRLSASDCGAPHERDRCWLVAHSNSQQFRVPRSGCNAFAPGEGKSQVREWERFWADAGERSAVISNANSISAQGLERVRNTWPAEPPVGRVVDGMAARMVRLKAIGNGQVPRVAATAFALLADF